MNRYSSVSIQNKKLYIKYKYFRLDLNLIKTMNRIEEVLEQKRIKQTWLSEKIGKSFNTVNSYVQNRQQSSLKTLYLIAEILDVEIKDLLVNNK